MILTKCPSCGGSVRCETIGWICNKCRGFIDMNVTFYPYKDNPFLTPQTNADHVRGMTDKELARILGNKGCPPEGSCSKVNNCVECYYRWLKQPYKEDDHG